MSKLDQLAYVIEDGKVIERKIRDFTGFIEETTTPQGVAPRYHTRGNELWTWGHAGNFPKIVRSFETEGLAEQALEDTFLSDFWNCQEITAFETRAQAENALALLDDDDNA